MIDKDVWPIIQISIDPRFEIKGFMDELQNEWTILGKHECFHQIYHDNYFAPSIFLTNIQNFCQYLHVCAQLQKTPIKLLQNLRGQLERKEMQAGDNFCYLSHNCPFEEAASLAMASHPHFIYMLQCIQTMKTSLQFFLEEYGLGFKFKQNS
jgi:hypothetical protein